MNTIYKIISFLVFICAGQQAMAQNFINQWNLATAGSGATQISFGTETSALVNYNWQEISSCSASGRSGLKLTIISVPEESSIRFIIAPTDFLS